MLRADGYPYILIYAIEARLDMKPCFWFSVELDYKIRMRSIAE